MLDFVAGGPAIFVVNWAIIKAFQTDSENIDGVSMNIYEAKIFPDELNNLKKNDHIIITNYKPKNGNGKNIS